MTTPPADDSDLRRLIDDALSDVHPDGGTKEIRARAHRPSAARWVPITLAAAVATILVITGSAWLGRGGDAPPAAQGGAANSPVSKQTDAGPDPGRSVQVPVYYVGRTPAGPRLFAETHDVEGVTGSNLDAAVQESLGAPALDPDYDVLSPVKGLLIRTSVDSSEITIDLSSPLPRPEGMGAAEAQMTLQAVVWTAYATTRDEAPVQFTVDGQPAAEVLGVDTSHPVQRASADAALATVSVGTPTQGTTVPTTFEVKGQAATFEANVVWELKQGNTIVRKGFTTATECCTLAPYSFTVTATPGEYTLVVHDTDMSDGEGIGTSEDTKQITVE